MSTRDKKTQVKVNEQYFTVSGKGKFPFDMLRYDSCFPAAQDDVLAMTTERFGGTLRLVTLLSRSAVPSVPTVDRWKSFGWTVEA